MTNTNDKLIEAIHGLGRATALANYIGLSRTELIAGSFTADEINMVFSALDEVKVPTEERVRFQEEAERDFILSFRRLVDTIKMAQGYEEMADINLKISEDSFYAEDEGEKRINELGIEDTDKEA